MGLSYGIAPMNVFVHLVENTYDFTKVYLEIGQVD